MYPFVIIFWGWWWWEKVGFWDWLWWLVWWVGVGGVWKGLEWIGGLKPHTSWRQTQWLRCWRTMGSKRWNCLMQMSLAWVLYLALALKSWLPFPITSLLRWMTMIVPCSGSRRMSLVTTSGVELTSSESFYLLSLFFCFVLFLINIEGCQFCECGMFLISRESKILVCSCLIFESLIWSECLFDFLF